MDGGLGIQTALASDCFVLKKGPRARTDLPGLPAICGEVFTAEASWLRALAALGGGGLGSLGGDPVRWGQEGKGRGFFSALLACLPPKAILSFICKIFF